MEDHGKNREEGPQAPKFPKRDIAFVELYEWIESAVLAVVFVILLFTFGARTSVVSGSSMIDTLHDGDMLFISRWGFSADQGDIVVVTKPYEDNEPIIKRIVATEGQRVDIDFVEGIVYVNGEALDEPYTHTPTNRHYDMEFPLTVPEGHVFVMGDNRNGSYDSRASEIGFVDTRYVLGKAYLRVFPFDALGTVH
ncbi:MAG: signal peptidase I [Oscillospiraceae bacterium]|nr:signal peptidase I [Oscillospiraceae bacterium]MDY3219670.1 signal peptidase I [Candidatus Fimivivens sp.]